MENVENCPICQEKLKESQFFNFIEKSCYNGYGHWLTLLIDSNSLKVINARFCLDVNGSKIISISFKDKKTTIQFLQNSVKYNYIELDYSLEPDFPELTKLKNKINNLLFLF